MKYSQKDSDWRIPYTSTSNWGLAILVISAITDYFHVPLQAWLNSKNKGWLIFLAFKECHSNAYNGKLPKTSPHPFCNKEIAMILKGIYKGYFFEKQLNLEDILKEKYYKCHFLKKWKTKHSLEREVEYIFRGSLF